MARWQKTEQFQQAYQAAKDALLEGAINSLRGHAALFTATLATIAGDEKAHDNARVRASEVGLSLLLKASEIEDLLRRITKLVSS